jgi:hypothetical protein
VGRAKAGGAADRPGGRSDSCAGADSRSGWCRHPADADVDTDAAGTDTVGADELADSPTEPVEVLDLAGVLRLVQAVNSPRADRLKGWLAATAAQNVRDADDPERAAARARRDYESKGYNRRWVGQAGRRRVGPAGADRRVVQARGGRQRRVPGADQRRRAGAFGMDTTAFRALKG